MRANNHHRRKPQPPRLKSAVALLTVFLIGSIELLKWEIANFVLNDESFDKLRNNFLAKYHLLPPLHVQHHVAPQQQQRQLYQDHLQQLESFPVTSFQFGFFNNLYRAPTQEEYEGLLCQTKAYLLRLFQRKLGGDDSGNFIYVNLYSANWTYAPRDPSYINHTVVVHATLEDMTPIPTDEVVMVVRASDMAEYIEQFVWRTEPHMEGTFFDTNRVTTSVGVAHQQGYTHREDQVDGITLSSSVHCPANGYYEAKFTYGYFPGYAKKPSQSEIEDLIPLSATFFQHKLQQSYPTRYVKVRMVLMGWLWDDVANPNMPLTMITRMLATFEDNNDVIPLEYVKEKLAHNETTRDTIMQEYIKAAVWETPPFKESTFWNVNRASMNSKIFRFAYNPNTQYGESHYHGGHLFDDDETIGFVGRPGNVGRPGDEDAFSAPEKADEFPNRAGGFDFGLPGLADEEGEDDEGTNETATDERGPSRSSIFTQSLGPVTVSDEDCRRLLKESNADYDRFLTTKEYVKFTNSMTNDTFNGFPFVALPDKVMAVFQGMAIKNDNGQEAIDMLGAFRPDISAESLNLLEDARADKVCKYFKSTINRALANEGPIESARVNSTIDFYLEHQPPEEEPEPAEPNMGVLDTAFENLIGNTVGPAVEGAMAERLRRQLKHRRLNKRQLALQIMRHLEESSPAHVLPDSARVNHIEETECRGGGKKTCYTAEAGVDVFLKGDKIEEMAPKAAAQTEQHLEDSVVNGDLQKEISALDPSWTVKTLWAPTSTPSHAPSLAPTISAAPTQVPTVQPTKAPKGLGKKIVEGGVATAAVGTVILMVALQCGREFLVDLFIRVCKIFCGFFRREEEDESEYDSDDENEGTEDDTGKDDSEFQSKEFDDIKLDGSHRAEEDEDEDDEDSDDEDGSDDEDDSEDESSEEDDSAESETVAAAPAPPPFPFASDEGSADGSEEEEESSEEEDGNEDESAVERGGIGEEEDDDSAEDDSVAENEETADAAMAASEKEDEGSEEDQGEEVGEEKDEKSDDEEEHEAELEDEAFNKTAVAAAVSAAGVAAAVLMANKDNDEDTTDAEDAGEPVTGDNFEETETDTKGVNAGEISDQEPETNVSDAAGGTEVQVGDEPEASSTDAAVGSGTEDGNEPEAGDTNAADEPEAKDGDDPEAGETDATDRIEGQDGDGPGASNTDAAVGSEAEEGKEPVSGEINAADGSEAKDQDGPEEGDTDVADRTERQERNEAAMEEDTSEKPGVEEGDEPEAGEADGTSADETTGHQSEANSAAHNEAENAATAGSEGQVADERSSADKNEADDAATAEGQATNEPAGGQSETISTNSDASAPPEAGEEVKPEEAEAASADEPENEPTRDQSDTGADGSNNLDESAQKETKEEGTEASEGQAADEPRGQDSTNISDASAQKETNEEGTEASLEQAADKPTGQDAINVSDASARTEAGEEDGEASAGQAENEAPK